MSAPPYDPENIPADTIYAQIRDAGAELLAIRAKRKTVQIALRGLIQQEKSKIAELVLLRRSITIAIVGYDIDPSNPDPNVESLPEIPAPLDTP